MFRFPPLTPFVKKLLITLFAAWIVQIILQNWVGVGIVELLALRTGSIGLPTVWQLFTHVLAAPTELGYMFSMLITLVFLWWMLAPFEQRFGQKRTIQLCVVSVLASGIAGILVGLLLAGSQRMYGAGAIIYTAIAAFAWSYRGRGRMSFFGVIDMKAEHIIYLVVALSGLRFLISRDLVTFAADLAAIGAGIGFIEWMKRPPRRRRIPKRKRPRKRKSSLDVIEGGRADEPRWLN
ncbi:MAG: rhomboid family intramembrane serine protease [Myxococcota bacterium]